MIGWLTNENGKRCWAWKVIIYFWDEWILVDDVLKVWVGVSDVEDGMWDWNRSQLQLHSSIGIHTVTLTDLQPDHDKSPRPVGVLEWCHITLLYRICNHAISYSNLIIHRSQSSCNIHSFKPILGLALDNQCWEKKKLFNALWLSAGFKIFWEMYAASTLAQPFWGWNTIHIRVQLLFLEFCIFAFTNVQRRKEKLSSWNPIFMTHYFYFSLSHTSNSTCHRLQYLIKYALLSNQTLNFHLLSSFVFIGNGPMERGFIGILFLLEHFHRSHFFLEETIIHAKIYITLILPAV